MRISLVSGRARSLGLHLRVKLVGFFLLSGVDGLSAPVAILELVSLEFGCQIPLVFHHALVQLPVIAHVLNKTIFVLVSMAAILAITVR